MARRAGLGKRRVAGVRGVEQREHRTLRIGNNREAADIWNVRRRNVHGAAEIFDPFGGGVDVIHRDISDPARRRSHFPGVLRLRHHPADRHLSGGKHRVSHAGNGPILGVPADHFRIESLRGLRIARHQLVPNKTAPLISHVCVSVRVGSKNARLPKGQVDINVLGGSSTLTPRLRL